MHKHNHGGIDVDWTDGEWRRLQAIKQKHFDNPNWDPPKRNNGRNATALSTNRIQVDISPLLAERIRNYISKHDIGLSSFVRTVMEVITDEDTT